jgi:hypothetical protein
MSVTIIGSVRNLNISCGKGGKYLHGEVLVEGLRALGFLDSEISDHAPNYVSIYAERSEVLKSLLIVGNHDKRHQPVIDRYMELQSLLTIDREGDRLFFSVMLPSSNFDYFLNFIEKHFFNDLEYRISTPFLGFPISPEARAEVASSLGLFLPTEAEFNTGKPCLFPNSDISFVFVHP